MGTENNGGAAPGTLGAVVRILCIVGFLALLWFVRFHGHRLIYWVCEAYDAILG